MYYVYILKSEKNSSIYIGCTNDSYYVGSCKNLEKRLALHNKGLVRSTKRYIPWEVVYFESYKTSSLARKRESGIKSLKSRSAIENLIKHFKN